MPEMRRIARRCRAGSNVAGFQIYANRVPVSILDHLLPDFPEDQKGERKRLLGLMAVYFLVVTAVGIMKPAKNALALSGLPSGAFYRTYLVSAAVILFVPIYNRLADKVGWRTLVPAVAFFFSANLVLFRLAYREGSMVYGLAFYGWYDLFSAALVTQFFAATQLLLNARTARSAYPLVIGGGAIGAALGGGISASLAHVIGTPDLLLVAAAFILAFGIGILFVWPEDESGVQRARAKQIHRREQIVVGEFRQVFSNPHVQLIALTVLLAIMTKQFVDYEFNTLSEQQFGTLDAITRFQGIIGVISSTLPILSVLALRPVLRRWGVGVAVFILPVLMLVSTAVMAAAFSIYTVVIARTSDLTFRYSAERAGREILYVPVPDPIKLKAKTYIDVGIEKGFGKAFTAVLIFALVDLIGVPPFRLRFVVVGLALAWLAATVAIRREYVRTLARSIRGRFASFQGLSTLADASTVQVVRSALTGSDPVQTSFALDLVDQSGTTNTAPIKDALHDLLDHASPDIRGKALSILARDPGIVDIDRVRARLHDTARGVREQAVLAVVAVNRGHVRDTVAELMRDPDTGVRTATLACLTRGEIEVEGGDVLDPGYLDERWQQAYEGDRSARIELALAAGAMRTHPRARELLEPFLHDPDPLVASAAIRSAGLIGEPDFHAAIIAGLKAPGTRHAAREALADQGPRAVDILGSYLLDESAHPSIRRHIPSVLARVADQKAATLMLHSVVAPETDQLLDYRTLKALSQLRARFPDLSFDRDLVLASIFREVDAAARYAMARGCLHRLEARGPAASLLARSLKEAWSERQEGVFRLMGLLYPHDEVYRCFLAVRAGERSSSANAVEWLEEVLDRSLFEKVGPVLGEARLPRGTPAPDVTLAPLLLDGDPWIARLAVATLIEIGAHWSLEAVRGIIVPSTRGDLRTLAERLLADGDAGTRSSMDLIEKVFLLQKIDLLQDARSAHLALLASIAEEVEVEAGTVLIREDEPTDALYVVVDGRVEMRGVADQRLLAGPGQAFGTWALIDEAPSLVTATTVMPSRLLRIARADFYDLLADHAELALGLLQGLARRVRTLVA